MIIKKGENIMINIKNNINDISIEKKDLSSKYKILHLKDYITEETYQTYKTELNELLYYNPKYIITNVDTFGGCILTALGIIDMVESIKKANKDIVFVTYTNTKLFSAGVPLFLTGDIRIMSEHSLAIVHDASSGTIGKLSDMKEDLRRSEILKSKMFKYMDLRTNKNEGFWINKLKDVNNVDLTLESYECKEYNICTNVGCVSLNVNLNIDEKLEII